MTAARQEGDNGSLRFSIVIANYNYARFVARAIDSALSLNWPHVEVIVVDDGSTDNSKQVIDTFADKVTTIYQANGGQRSANNRGFAASHGDIIVFLDADDVLGADFARTVAAAWRPGVSKVQVQMERVDADEHLLGSRLPAITRQPSPTDIRRWALTTTEYPTPPGSANAYSRDFLQKFFPIGPEHDAFTDSTCLALAPILGDVVTVLKPLVLYRQHGSNDSNLLASPGRFGREVARAMARQKSIAIICENLGIDPPAAKRLRASRHLLQLRIASLRMDPAAHPLADDNRKAALFDTLLSVGRHGSDSLAKRLRILGWSFATLIVPQAMARSLVYWRFGGANGS